MIFLWFGLSLILYCYVNGSMDFVSVHLGHHDLWHLLKYFDRLFLLLVGWSGLKLIRYVWIKYRNALHRVLIFGFLFLLLIFAKTMFWNYGFYSHSNRLRMARADISVQIDTGWDWLDKQLGFHNDRTIVEAL